MENVKDGIVVLQDGYAKKIIERFDMKESKRCSTSLDDNMKVRNEEGSLLSNPLPYCTLVESLIYLTITRPYIAFMVGVISRYM